ncbi:MAG: recombinase family protein [Clostridia bacterium]
MRVSAYCRVSTEKSDQLNSMKNQCEFFKNYIKDNPDWKLYNIYCDEGISGTSTKKRIQFTQMIEDAKNGYMDLILTKEISRFGRNTVDVLHYTRLLKSYKTDVFFINDGINTSQNDGELRLAIMSSIAQEESRKISDRVKFGQNQSMLKGTVFGNGNIYGFELLNGELILNCFESEIIRNIFCMYTFEHMSVTDIAKKHINNKKNFSEQSIINILKNEKYVGDLCQKKSITSDYLSHKRKMNNGNKVYIKDHHKAIISRKLWNLTNDEQKKRKEKRKSKFALSGQIQCINCNEKFLLKRSKHGEIFWNHKCNEKVVKISQKSFDNLVLQMILFLKIDFNKSTKRVIKLFKSFKIQNEEKVLDYVKKLEIYDISSLKNELISNIMVFDNYIVFEIPITSEKYKISYKINSKTSEFILLFNKIELF